MQLYFNTANLYINNAVYSKMSQNREYLAINVIYIAMKLID